MNQYINITISIKTGLDLLGETELNLVSPLGCLPLLLHSLAAAGRDAYLAWLRACAH